MSAIRTFTHAGLTVEIIPDDDAYSPRDEDSRTVCSTIADWTRNQFGEEHWGEEFEPVIDCPHCEAPEWEEECEQCDDTERIAVSPQRYAEVVHGALASVLVHYADYGSSGARIYEAPHDNNANGIIYVTREQWETAQGQPFDPDSERDREMARALMIGDLEEYDQFLQGFAYGYVVKGPDGEELDSCWGFIGDLSDDGYIIGEARAAAEGEAEGIAREARERDEMAARDIVTV